MTQNEAIAKGDLRRAEVHGGALCLRFVTSWVTDTTFERNAARAIATTTDEISSSSYATGGAIDALYIGVLFLSQTSFEENTCEAMGKSEKATAAALGGGLSADGSVYATRCRVVENRASASAASRVQAWGGGIEASCEYFEMEDSTVAKNVALATGANGNSEGGGLKFHAATNKIDRVFPPATIALRRNTFERNDALFWGQQADSEGVGRGGGLVTRSSSSPLIGIVTNCTFASNRADAGAGIFLQWRSYPHEDTNVEILNCTISGGFAKAGGGIYVDDYFFGGAAPTIRNTLVAENVASLEGPDVFGEIISQGFNLIGRSDGGDGFVASDQLGTISSPLDPGLGSFGPHGGPTDTYFLLPNSPARDRGSNVDVPSTDQRSFPRIRDGDGDGVATVDVGAYEAWW